MPRRSKKSPSLRTFWRVRRRTRPTSVTKHYVAHKEMARRQVLARLHHYNQFYGLVWNRVAIRNQRSCWGSCTSLGNLNFSYKLLFLPDELFDYVVVHELCHLKHLHHGKEFWDEVEKVIPDWQERMYELKRIERSFEPRHYLEQNF